MQLSGGCPDGAAHQEGNDGGDMIDLQLGRVWEEGLGCKSNYGCKLELLR